MIDDACRSRWARLLGTALLIVAGCSRSVPPVERPVEASASRDPAAEAAKDVLAGLDDDLASDGKQLGVALEDSSSSAAGRRAAALAAMGQYTAALAELSTHVSALPPNEKEALSQRASLWEILRYTATDGGFSYDEDLRVREPTGLVSSQHTSVDERGALYAIGSTLTMTAQLLAMPNGASYLGKMSERPRSQLCHGDQPCLRGLRRTWHLTRQVDPKAAIASAITLAKELEKHGEHRAAGELWMLIGDAQAAPNSTPFELNLFPFGSDSKAKQRSGNRVPEFEPITAAQAAEACDGYHKAQQLWQPLGCVRCAANLAYRQSYLSTMQGSECTLDGAIGDVPFARAAQLFDQARDRRRSLSSRTAQLAWARREGVEADRLRGELLALAQESDPGPVMGAARVLSHFALLQWSNRGKLNEAHSIYEDAMALAETHQADFLATRIGAEEAELSSRLGRLVEANELRMRHLKSVEAYAVAIEANKVLATEIPKLKQTLCLEAFDLVFGVRANLLALHAVIGPEWSTYRDKAEQYVNCMPDLGAGGKESLLSALESQEIVAKLYERKFDQAIERARKMQDVPLEALALLLDRKVPAALQLMKKQVDRALTVAKQAGSGSASQTLLQQAARSTLEPFVSGLIRGRAFKEARALIARADEARGAPWLFVSDEQPWERPYTLARIAAGLGEIQSADELYAQALALLDRPAMDRPGRGTFDDNTAYIRNEHINFLARTGRVDEALSYFESTRRRRQSGSAATLPTVDVPALVYHFSSDASGVFVVQPGSRPVYLPLDTQAQDLTPNLRSLLSNIGQPQEGWEQGARRVYTLLFKSVDRTLGARATDVRTVLIVPHGEVQALPFQVLLGPDGKPLVERYNFIYSTDLSAYDAARARAARQSNDGSALQAIAFNGQQLTQAEQEAKSLVGEALVSDQAGGATLLRLLTQPGVLHIGAHAEQDFLRPRSSAIFLADGPLRLSAFDGLQAQKRVVVLSACDTANALLGLGENRATWPNVLLDAGVSTVVGTQWKIKDTRSELLTDTYASLQAGKPLAAALGEAQRKQARKKDRHPYYWASYSAYGAGL
jgi:CHAT domain-containing protein